MTENNYIDRIIKGENTDGGEFKKQRESYLEFVNFEKKEEKKNSFIQKKYEIEFLKIDAEEDRDYKMPMKLAADSGNLDSNLISRKSGFFISTDGDFAIKYSKKLNEEYHLTVLSENEEYSGEVILYSEEIDKYFISNTNGEFIIGQYFKYDISKFNFKAILPFETIILLTEGNDCVTIPINKLSSPEVEEITDLYIKIRINPEKDFKNAVLKCNQTKDFIKTDGKYVEIPKMLLSKKAELYIY